MYFLFEVYILQISTTTTTTTTTTTGTAGAHVKDNITNEETTAPSREFNLGAHVSETNQATLPYIMYGRKNIRGTWYRWYFLGNTNPTDVPIVTVNSEIQMAGSHITKFHTSEDKEITPEDFLSQVNQHLDSQHDQQHMAPNRDTDHEHQNTGDSTSNPSIDTNELVTHEDESIPSVAIQD